jgi:3D (Asp-Asp-Asp) domain-containing protein
VGFLTNSLPRKVLVTVVAVGGFVGLYEVNTRDSIQRNLPSRPRPGSRVAVSATAYCKGTTTAAGVAVQSGAAASDPTFLPLGSVVQIETGNQQYDGMYTILDTGPEIKGREVDIYIWSCHEALRFGRRQVQVTVLRQGWDPRATRAHTPSLLNRIFRRPTSEPAPPPLQSHPLPPNP